MYPKKEIRNKIICHLIQLTGWTFYSIEKGLKEASKIDRRNAKRIWDRDKDKYPLPKPKIFNNEDNK